MKGIVKIKTEINQKITEKQLTKVNKTKNQLFQKINKSDKPLAKPTKKNKREETNCQHQ